MKAKKYSIPHFYIKVPLKSIWGSFNNLLFGLKRMLGYWSCYKCENYFSARTIKYITDAENKKESFFFNTLEWNRTMTVTCCSNCIKDKEETK